MGLLSGKLKHPSILTGVDTINNNRAVKIEISIKTAKKTEISINLVLVLGRACFLVWFLGYMRNGVTHNFGHGAHSALDCFDAGTF